MKKDGKITSLAHIEAIKQCKPGMHEYQLQAIIESTFMHHGCRFPAYQSIIAGGKNACILHYVENSDPLNDGDLVLVDAGAEYQHYAGDITRTYPVNGKFTEPQKAIYNIVLEAHQAAIDSVKPNNHWNQPHEAALKIITAGLIKLGIIKETLEKAIEEQLYRPFFMHRTGHWLGMDVHDVGDYKVDNQWRILEPGMVLTIEPGIYIPATKGIAKKWHHIGVRIEDNVIVTKNGHDVITKVPTSVDDIESLMASHK
jgi:aminopeptidase P (EC:3.4.11.9). Metallo peptidase. MEROPS family M24B